MLGIRNYPPCTRLFINARFTAIRSMNDLLKNRRNIKQPLYGNFATHAICLQEQSSIAVFLKRNLPASDQKNAFSQRRFLFHSLLPRIKSSLTSRDLACGSFETKLFRFVTTNNQSFKAATLLFHQKSTLVTPNKPAEPEYCCMGGCVECVWDKYAEELKAWHDHNNKIAIDKRPCELADSLSIENAMGGIRGEKKVREQNPENDTVTEKTGSFNSQIIYQIGNAKAKSSSGTRNSTPGIAAEKRVDRNISQLEDNDGISHLPVEIREFMKLEKRLKGGK